MFVQTAETSVLHLPDNGVNKPLSSQYQSLKSPLLSSLVRIRMKNGALENLKKVKSKLFVKKDFWGLIVFVVEFDVQRPGFVSQNKTVVRNSFYYQSFCCCQKRN